MLTIHDKTALFVGISFAAATFILYAIILIAAYKRKKMIVNEKGELLNEGEDIIHENSDGYNPHVINDHGGF